MITTVPSRRLRTIVRGILRANATVVSSNPMGPQSAEDARQAH